MELFECARCYLGAWEAILAARQRLLPALWALCGFPEEDRYDCFSTARRLWCRSCCGSGSIASGRKTLEMPSKPASEEQQPYNACTHWVLGVRRS